MNIVEQTIIFKILLSIILSGLIGMERERLNRPAGIRTHILVGVGATLVLLTSMHLSETYENIQIDRMAAQVISGIGFLGAGTIIQQGNTIQGLTTAAGIWTVACIGLAVGSGFYFAAVMTTLIVLMTLSFFKKIEKSMNKINRYLDLDITLINEDRQIKKILEFMEDMKVIVQKIELIEKIQRQEEHLTKIAVSLKLPNDKMKNDILDKIISQDNVIKVSKRAGGKF